MFKSKIAYIIVLIFATVFFVMYKDYLGFITFLSVFIIPLLFLIILAISSFRVKAKIKLKDDMVQKGDDIEVNILVSNYAFFPIKNACIKIKYYNIVDKQEKYEYITIPLPVRSKQKVKIHLKTEYCGSFEIILDSIMLYDYLGLFSRKKKFKQEEVVLVMPRLKAIEHEYKSIEKEYDDAIHYSGHESGDDISEVFDIREYQAGDKIPTIHWKLSAKQDDLMVKEYSKPLNQQIIILVELALNDKVEKSRLLDRFLEELYSLSNYLICEGYAHVVIWYDYKRQELRKFVIEFFEDLVEFMKNLLMTDVYSTEDYALSLYQDEQMSVETCFYFTGKIFADTIQHLLEGIDTVSNQVFCIREAIQDKEIKAQFAIAHIELYDI